MHRGLVAVALALALLAGSVLAVPALDAAGQTTATFAVPDTAAQPPSNLRECAAPVPAGYARCHSRLRTDGNVVGKAPARTAAPQSGTLGNNGAYDPSYLQSAYNLASASASAGYGLTVAIVDAYDDPTAEADLSNYRTYFGLPACTTSNGCFRKVNQNGVSGSYPALDRGWAQEISLDMDMVSAICPHCDILLVEANSNSLPDLGASVNTAARLGAMAISNSYGGTEYASETSDEATYYNHVGIAITVSAGDNGYGAEFPAASQYVTAVGGTTLNQATNTGARNATQTVWSGTGSGCSAYATKPSWQTDRGSVQPTIGDVAALADPNTGVWVYDTTRYNGQSGWLVFGGTSVSSPLAASVYARPGNTAAR